MSIPAYTNYAKPYNKVSPMSAAKPSYQYILTFRQQAALELGIVNVNQALILELLSIAHEWATPEYVDGIRYYWTARQKICAELPLLDLKPDTVARYLKSLAQLGLIEHIKSGKKDLTRVTEKALHYVGKKSNIVNDDAMSEKNPSYSEFTMSENFPSNSDYYVGKKSEKTTEKNPTYQYNYLNQGKDIPPYNPPKGDVSDSSLENQSLETETIEPVSKPVKLDTQPAEPKSAKTRKAIEPTAAYVLDQFEHFWKTMPLRKVGKDLAQRAFVKTTAGKTEAEVIKGTAGLLADLAKRFKHIEGYDSSYRLLHPATYLNQRRWTDEDMPERKGKLPVTAEEVAKRLIVPEDIADGGTQLQKWAVSKGFRAAKSAERGWDYLQAVKEWAAEKNGGAV
jgi:uncharacterized membrane protein